MADKKLLAVMRWLVMVVVMTLFGGYLLYKGNLWGGFAGMSIGGASLNPLLRAIDRLKSRARPRRKSTRPHTSRRD